MASQSPSIDMSMFRIDEDIRSLLDGMDSNELIAFAELHDDPSSFDQVELHTYSCFLIFLRTRSTEHLSIAIQRAEGWISVTEADEEDRARRLEILNTLVALQYQFNPAVNNILERIRARLASRIRSTSMSDRLKRAAAYGFDKVKTLPRTDPKWAQHLMNLGRVLHTSFDENQAVEDLDCAIEFATMAVEATASDSPVRAARLSNLASWLDTRYQVSSSLSDLNRSFELLEQSIELTPQGHSSRAIRLNNAGNSLGRRFQMTGEAEYLNRAIDYIQAAVESIPPNSGELLSHHGLVLRNLGHWLSVRYDLTGSMDDLQYAINACEKSVDIQRGGDDWGSRLGTLGSALARRAKRTASISDFQQALHFLREAIKEDRLDDPYRDEPYNNLGLLLQYRHSQTGDKDDLNAALECLHTALNMMREGHPEQAHRLINLSALYPTRFESSSAMEDIDKGLGLSDEAMSILPIDHPMRAGLLSNRAVLLDYRFQITESVEDETLLLNTLTNSWHCLNSPPTVRVQSAMRAGRILGARCKWEEASSLLEEAVRVLPSVSPRFLKNPDKQNELQWFTGLGSAAAAAALHAGKEPSHALQLLESGRNIISSLLMDMRGDLSELEQEYPELASKFRHLRDILDSPEKAPEAGSLSPAGLRLDTDRDLRKLLDHIRTRPGFERFLLPPTVGEFMAAANPDPIVVLNATQTRGDAFLIEHHRIRSLELPGLTVQELTTRMAGSRATLGAAASAVPLEWLWDTICGPVLDELGFSDPVVTGDNWPRVWWIPTGALSLVPLHAAGYHQPGSTKAVIDRVMSSYSSSIRALKHRGNERVQQQTDALFNRALIVAMRDTPGMAASGTLPFAAAEAEMLAALCPRMNLELCIPAARKVDVLDSLRSSRIFHFAGHGAPDRTDPSRSRLLLQDWQSDPLTVEDIRNLSLSQGQEAPFLGYLSACSTGVSENERLIDEGIHLVSSLQLAGFRHVVGTLWEVVDRYCVDVARILYETLCEEGLNDLSVCRGLHRATRELRAGRIDRVHVGRKATLLGFGAQSTHPANTYWVPFIHYGTVSGNRVVDGVQGQDGQY